jgi:hypothetical protein
MVVRAYKSVIIGETSVSRTEDQNRQAAQIILAVFLLFRATHGFSDMGQPFPTNRSRNQMLA